MMILTGIFIASDTGELWQSFKTQRNIVIKSWFGLVWFNPLQCFFGSEGHLALDRNPGSGYDTLLLRLIPGDLLSACPHRQFRTLPGLLDSRAALSNSYRQTTIHTIFYSTSSLSEVLLDFFFAFYDLINFIFSHYEDNT